ncbi:MAG: hypothetical protein IJA35_00610 [Clostridia bacterium]|nr:hypothetical protein [Oscillospiraceae bacterium]MBQ3551650.1 hypothetical protein [Clostridia bacterium]
MTNKLQKTAQDALVITQQYPMEKYNLLVPMQTVAEIAEIHKPVLNVVSISTNPDDKEIYVQEKSRDAWTDKNGRSHPGSPAKYALTKKGLTKLMRAAGIKILSSRPVVPSTCQKCAATNASIGGPVKCGICPNKDVKHEVRISVPQLTGENIEIVAHKEIIVDDVVVGMTDAQRVEFLKFRSEMCESKALNRALRTAMQIKGTYSIEEFKKPFVVAYLVPNLDNPIVREEAVKSLFAAAHELYGTTQSASEARRTVYVDDDMQDDERGAYEAHATPMQTAQPVGGYQADLEQQPQNGEIDPNTCVKCCKTLSGGVSRFSINNYGIPLCMECQKAYSAE